MFKKLCLVFALVLVISALCCGCGKTGSKDNTAPSKTGIITKTVPYKDAVFEGYEKVPSEDSDETFYYYGTKWVDNEFTKVVIKPNFGEKAKYSAMLAPTACDFTIKLENCTKDNALDYEKLALNEGYEHSRETTDTDIEYTAFLQKEKMMIFLRYTPIDAKIQISYTMNSY